MLGQPLNTGPFVGRGADLAQLRCRVEEALAGANACAWVVGEAGVGKTRLVHEVALYARLRGAAVRWNGSSAFLESASVGDGTASPSRSAPGPAELVVIDGVETAAARATAVEQLTATEGTSRLVLGTSRHPPPDPLATILRERSVELIVLGGLDEDALGRLLDALWGEGLDGDLVTAVLRSTQGNPGRARRWLTQQRAARSAGEPAFPQNVPTPSRRHRPRA